jgi:hypothetical protein
MEIILGKEGHNFHEPDGLRTSSSLALQNFFD